MYVNQAFADMLGYSKRELLGRQFIDFLHPSEKGRITHLFLRIILLRRQPRNFEFRALHRDGHVLHLMSRPTRFVVNGKAVGFQAIIMDITERKEMEKYLEETNRKLQMLFETAMEGITIVDASENLTFVNKAFANMLGYREDELIGMNLRKLVDEKSFNEIGRQTEYRRKGTVNRYEIAMHHKDGKQRRVQVSASPLWKENGVFAGSLGIVMDITDRKRVEDALRNSEKKSRMLLENLPQKIFFKDKDSVYVSCNENYARDLKIHHDEISGKTDYDFYPKELAEKYRADDKRIMMSGKTEDIEEEYIQDGQRISVHTVKTPVLDEKGNGVGILGIFWDITEHKNAEIALLENKQKFERLFKNNPDASVYVDADDRILDANSRFVKLFGYSLEEAKGKALDDLIVPENKRKEAKKMTEKSVEGYIYFETVRKKKDGSVIPVSMSAAPIYVNHQLAGCVISYRDITERVQMQKKLAEYSEQLEEMVKERTRQLQETQEQLVKNERLAAIGQVAAMVGHDLRNPLTGISGATYYLKRKLGSKIDKSSEEMIRLIEENVEYSDKIVSDLLEYSREIKLEPTKIAPKSIFGEVLSSVKIPSNIRVLDSTTDESEAEIDVQKMKRVFVNIINNAFDAMPNGGTLKITTTQKNGKLQIAFSDTGLGIPEEVLEKVWTPFFTTKAKGMGLGLPICKRIIEAHHGDIIIESAVGKGTTFIITVPLKLEIKEGGEKVWVNEPKSLLSTTTKA
jgi:PAS domain S-box-containing protein